VYVSDCDCKTMSFVIIQTEKIVDKKVQGGILFYPSCQGQFRSVEEEQNFRSLFAGDAPNVPFAGVGKIFGPEKFTEQEQRDCILEYLKKHYSQPKDIEHYWDKDEAFHNKLRFPLIAPSSPIRDESPEEAASRGLWQCTGIKVKRLEHVGSYKGKHVYRTKIFIDHAKWEWMNHQAEKLTLTDWDVCPHFDLLEEFGVPKIVLESYCRTHGGPRFVSNIHDHLVDNTTKELFLQFFTEHGVLKRPGESKSND